MVEAKFIEVANFLRKKGCNLDKETYTGQTVLGLLISKRSYDLALHFYSKLNYKNLNHSEMNKDQFNLYFSDLKLRKLVEISKQILLKFPWSQSEFDHLNKDQKVKIS